MSDEFARMADGRPKRRSRWAIVLALLALYPLSWGPVFVLCTRLTMTVDASGAASSFIPGPVTILYLPIILLEENVPGADVLFDQYISLIRFLF